MGQRPFSLGRFLRELKRRRVVRVASVYAAVAFVVVQVADLVFPALMLPPWLNRAVIVLVALGFPIALVLAWAFDVTPEGVQRAGGSRDPGQDREGRAADPWLSLSSAVAVGGLVLVGVGLGWLLGGSGGEAAGTVRGTAAGGGEGSGYGPLIQLSVSLGEGTTLAGPGPVAISPDGGTIVYAASRGDTARLYVRSLERADAEAMPGTEGARSPFFSPDGAWIGFFSGGGLKKVAAAGGAPVDVAEFRFPAGGNWGRNDTIYIGTRRSGPGRGLWRVPAAGGAPEQLTSTDQFDLEWPEQGHVWPQLLPGGRAVLYTVFNLPEDTRVALYDRATGERRVLIDRGMHARYVAPGYLVYAWSGDLLAVPFDLESLAVTGAPVSVAGDVAYSGRTSAGFAVSAVGTLLRVPGSWRAPGATLAWADLGGRLEELPYPPGSYAAPRVSPDGSRILVTKYEDRSRLWVLDPARGMATRLTGDAPMEFWPAWGPDGRTVVHNSNRHGGPGLNLYRTPVDGSGEPERLTRSEYNHQAQSWTPDGGTLFFTVANVPGSPWDIWTLDLPGDEDPLPLLQGPDEAFHPIVSPAGGWLAYVSNRSGNREVYVRRYPGTGGVAQVSPAGGWEPLWSPRGDRIYYRDASGDSIWAARFRGDGGTGSGEPRVDRPELLFTGEFTTCCPPGRNYDLSPDGSRFLVILEGGPPPPPRRIDVIMNWFGELERLAGSERSR